MELWARTSPQTLPPSGMDRTKETERESEQVFAYIFHCLADLHRDDI